MMKRPTPMNWIIALVSSGLLFTSLQIKAVVLDENCVISILNRTIQVNTSGDWSLPNVPSNMGLIRARANCIANGQTFSGQSDYFVVPQDGIVDVSDIKFEDLDPIPSSLSILPTNDVIINSIEGTVQLNVVAAYPDGISNNITQTDGTNYSSTNISIAIVNTTGLVTAKSSGSVLITVRKDGALTIKRVTVLAGGDTDGDQIPDDFEVENGLNPNDPIDAHEDQDRDGLTALEEFNLGTGINTADTDGDGIDDGEETVKGEDGFVTNPLLRDTDGDGLSDGLEILVSSSPIDPNDRNLSDALESIEVTPPSASLTFNNGVDSESSVQLAVVGLLIDGTQIDLTNTSTGTNYISSDLLVVNFGNADGEIFASSAGTASVTVSNSGFEVIVPVTVTTFDPVALSAISIPGYANNVDVAGDYAFIAAGFAGLQILDISDRANPIIVANLDTDGTAIDVKIHGNFAYIADGETGVKIINIRNPLLPLLVGSVNTGHYAQDIVVDKQYAYVADGTNGLVIIDISNSSFPFIKSVLSGIGNTIGLDVEGDRVVIVSSNTLFVIDVTEKAGPVTIGSVNIGAMKDIVLEGNYAHVAAHSLGYRIVDISDPQAPIILSGDASIAPHDVALSGNLAFYADQLFPNAIAYINVRDPSNPVFQGIIDLSTSRDYAGIGIALDGGYVYSTREDSDSNTKLFIAQYSVIDDLLAVPPILEILQPQQNGNIVEGTMVNALANASDDIGVKSVSFYINGELQSADSTEPYEAILSIPFGNSTATLTVTALDFGGNKTNVDRTFTLLPDSDQDGLEDSEETLLYGTDPLNPDTDGDGLWDALELSLGTNPLKPDSDSDGFTDKIEIDQGTDPLNPDTTPPTVIDVDPIDSAINVVENAIVLVKFSETLRGQSVAQNSVIVTNMMDSTLVSGKVTLMPNQQDLYFKPDALLTSFTNYRITVNGLRDIAGNIMTGGFESVFVTGDTIDTTQPNVVDLTPKSGSIDIPVNATITVSFDEPLDPETVNENTFHVSDSVINRPVAGIRILSANAQEITFIPNAPFPVGREFFVRVSRIQDLFGNQYTKNYWKSFTTSFSSDAISPTIRNISIKNNAINVPTNILPSVKFSEVINHIKLSKLSLVTSAGDAVPFTIAVNFNHQGLTFQLAEILAANTDYIWTIDGIEDISGNIIAKKEVINFRTGSDLDSISPIVLSTIPYENAEDVPRNSVVLINVSEPLDPTSIDKNTVRLRNLRAQNLYVDGSVSLSNDGKTIIFTPDSLLTENDRYAFYISQYVQLRDISGNKMIPNFDISFKTGFEVDYEPLLLVSQSISDGTTNIPINGYLSFTFDDTLGEQCLSSSSVVLNSENESITGTISLSDNRKTLVFTPQTLLDVNTDYSVSLTGLCDLAGNMINDTTSQFTTSSDAAADNVNPDVSLVTPSDQSIDIPTSTDFIFEFSEVIDATSLESGINISTTNITKLIGKYTVNGLTVTFTPDVILPSFADVTVTVNKVYDLAHNLINPAMYQFTTGDGADFIPPKIISVIPNDNSIDVRNDTPIVLTFSESIDASTITADNIGLYANGIVYQPNISRSSDNRTITLTSTLPKSSLVSIIVTSDVMDMAGNLMTDFVSAFTTSSSAYSLARPSVTTQAPGNGAYDVDINSTISLYISRPMDTTTMVNAIKVSQNGILIDGALEFRENDQSFTFTPELPLAKDAIIEVFLDNSARDIYGNVAYSYQGSFRTEVDTSTRPAQIVERNPKYRSQNAPINSVVDIQFNEALDANSVNPGTVVLVDENGVEVNTIISTIKAGYVIRITPTSLLNPNMYYYVRFLEGIVDLDGTPLSQAYSYNYLFTSFFTGGGEAPDLTIPQVVAMSPSQGLTDVGINTHVHVRFDETINPVSWLPDSGKSGKQTIYFTNNNAEVRYVPHVYYPALTNVTETLPNVEDTAGNKLLPNSRTFTTGAGVDLTAPAVRSAIPATGSIDVPSNAVVRIEFSEAIDPVTVTPNSFYIDYTENGTIMTVAGSISINANNRILTFVPDFAWEVGKEYRVWIEYLSDLSGNGIGRKSTNRFEVTLMNDVLAPQISKTSILSGTIDVPTNTVISVLFNEPINITNLDGINLFTSDNQLISVKKEFSGDHLEIKLKPIQPLLGQTAYLLSMASVEDLSGNLMANTHEVQFITAPGADFITPAISSRTPFVDATNVPTNSVIAAAINERINVTSINRNSVRLYDQTSTIWIEGTPSLSIDRKTIFFEPVTGNLEPNHRYIFYVGEFSNIYDLGGNVLPSGGSVHRFTTGELDDNVALNLISQSILDGATSIPLNAKFAYQFDNAIGDYCLSTDSVLISDGSYSIDGTYSFNKSQSILTFNPSEILKTDTTYEVSISGLCDLAGNQILPFINTFTTSSNNNEDEEIPVFTITPVNGETNVALNTDIVIEFSEVIDATSLNRAITISGGGNTYADEFSVNGTIVTFTPSTSFPPNTKITVSVSQVLDLAGNRSQSKFIQFTTGN